MPLEAIVQDLIAAVLRQYAKEQRLSALPSTVASDFDLHYSQFSLQKKQGHCRLNLFQKNNCLRA
ncbi:hypothetical protein PHJA_000212300 [Phtheirospermum japonicum]|uniref:DUF7054 domain-containing protein n=1 Tax=Phtheirospermum japonicum TaxID=374723 RepID=A0A830B008_9LAMI|nr:hypothetical protein PHJA_000212300 [Phtheirospermum japonicum]